jgi:hypothetical protein
MKQRQLVLPLVVTIVAIVILQIRYDHLLAIHTFVVENKPNRFKRNRQIDPLVNRWQHKFRDRDGYLFFKHIRKAGEIVVLELCLFSLAILYTVVDSHAFICKLLHKGGTTMRYYLYQVLKYHDNPRAISDFIRNVNPEHINAQFWNNLAKVSNLGEVELQMVKSALRNLNSNKTANSMTNNRYQIHYAEQEFSAMDWQCSMVDPRWKNTLSVIVLRHPIERHLSEYFYSGPGSSLGLDVKKLYGDESDKYRNRVKNKLIEELPNWLNETGADRRSLGWYFGRYYTDNFQLRALAGCAHGECLHAKQLTDAENTTILEGLEDYLNVTSSPSNGACTMYFNEKVKIIEPCRSFGRTGKGKFQALCPRGCDSPCRYPVAAWGSVQRDDLTRAITALNSYDAVFLTETLDHDDQSALLADMMGVPQNASFSLGSKNTKTKKTNEREKTHFYRDLLLKLTLTQLYDQIHEENILEIELFDHAVELNQQLTRQWKEESGWEQ